MSILKISKNIAIRHNVSLRVLDAHSGKLVQSHTGHNAATNSMLTGIGHYLVGDGIFNQGYEMLRAYVPQYISLGTMGLINQDEDAFGLPAGVGTAAGDASEEDRFIGYMLQAPGYGADGYDMNVNNNRAYAGLGPPFAARLDKSTTCRCELISASFPRSKITFRDVITEMEAELPQTIDIVYSALISTGALAQFRQSGKNYIFITEAGLWSRKDWSNSGENGLLAGYRIVPPDESNWDMTIAENRRILQENILRVGINQVVQVIWKLQIGSVQQLGGLQEIYRPEYAVRWNVSGDEYIPVPIPATGKNTPQWQNR